MLGSPLVADLAQQQLDHLVGDQGDRLAHGCEADQFGDWRIVIAGKRDVGTDLPSQAVNVTFCAKSHDVVGADNRRGPGFGR